MYRYSGFLALLLRICFSTFLPFYCSKRCIKPVLHPTTHPPARGKLKKLIFQKLFQRLPNIIHLSWIYFSSVFSTSMFSFSAFVKSSLLIQLYICKWFCMKRQSEGRKAFYFLQTWKLLFRLNSVFTALPSASIKYLASKKK